MDRLLDGYRAFRAGAYPGLADRFRQLAEEGQAPAAMIIGCCDSRVSPATLFRAAPGELFVVRNVAALVPPYRAGGVRCGTGAAVEYATTALDVGHIVVLGHSRCGGIAGFLEHRRDPAAAGPQLGPWLALLEEAYGRMADVPDAGPALRQRRLEHASIRVSLARLAGYPTVAARIAAGRLALAGAHFDVADGRLHLCGAGGTFRPAADPDGAPVAQA